MLLKYDEMHEEVKSQNYEDIHYVGTLVSCTEDNINNDS